MGRMGWDGMGWDETGADGWMDGWMSGWMNEWTADWLDGWMDGWMARLGLAWRMKRGGRRAAGGLNKDG